MNDKSKGLQSAANRLNDASEEVRYEAVMELARLKSHGAIPLLIEAVGDTSFRIREEALSGIASFSAEEIFPRLEDFVRNHENANQRNAAMEAFTWFKEKATPYLIHLLKDEDEEVRIFAAVMLGGAKDPVAVDALIDAMDDPDENVRHASIETLGKIADARAVDPLINSLGKEFWIQYPAISALGEIGDPKAVAPLISLLTNDLLKEAAIEALGRIGDIAVIPALSELLAQDDPTIRNDTIAALINIQAKIEKHILSDGNCLPSIKKTLDKTELHNHLIEALSDRNKEVVKNSVIALGWLQEKNAASKLIELLSDYDLEEYVVGALVSIGEGGLDDLAASLDGAYDSRVIGNIVRCIGWIGNPEYIKKCLPFLEYDDDEIKLQAISALSEVIDEEEIENALLDIIESGDTDTAKAAIEGLAKSQNAGLVDKLVGLLDSENDIAKINAIKLLSKLRSQTAFPIIRNMCSDENDVVRAEAYKALNEINPDGMTYQTLVDGLGDKSPTVRKASADTLFAIPRKEAESGLIALLKDPDSDVRISVLNTLGKISNASSVKHIISAYASGDKRFKLAVISVIPSFNDPACRKFLNDLLIEADHDIKRAAIKALGKTGDRKSAPLIIAELDDSDWSIRCEAIDALGAICDKKCVPHLTKMLDDPEDIVKRATVEALTALGAIDTVNFILPLVNNERLQHDVLRAIEKLGIPDVEYYFEFMEQVNTKVKCNMINAIGRIGNKDSFDRLIKTLDETFFSVRECTVKALAELGDKRAISHLLKLYKSEESEEVKRVVAEALKTLDSTK